MNPQLLFHSAIDINTNIFPAIITMHNQESTSLTKLPFHFRQRLGAVTLQDRSCQFDALHALQCLELLKQNR